MADVPPEWRQRSSQGCNRTDRTIHPCRPLFNAQSFAAGSRSRETLHGNGSYTSAPTARTTRARSALKRPKDAPKNYQKGSRLFFKFCFKRFKGSQAIEFKQKKGINS